MRPPIAPRPTLYELRTHAGYATQEAIAARLGVCVVTYRRYETGRTNPRGKMVRKLARLLQVREALLREVLRG